MRTVDPQETARWAEHYASSRSLLKTSAAFGVPWHTIRTRFISAGVPVRPKSRGARGIPSPKLEEALLHYSDGRLAKQIASDLGIDRKTFRRVVRAHGMMCRRRGGAHERHTKSEQRLWAEDHFGGLNIEEIAKSRGANRNSVRLALVRQGCETFRVGEKHHRYLGCGEITGARWCRIKRNRARSGGRGRKLSFTITIEFAWELFLAQGRKCALTGRVLSFNTKDWRFMASLDRIDSSKGYEPGNVHWVCAEGNISKMDRTMQEHIQYCRDVAANSEKEILFYARTL